MTTAVVLVWLAEPEPIAAVQLAAFADRREATSVAYLQRGGPALTTELTRLARAGVEVACVVGVDCGHAAAGRSWLRRVAGHWLRAEDTSMKLLVAPTLARSPFDDLEGIVTHVLSQGLSERCLVTGAEAPLTNPEWERVPGHRHQVFVCEGVRCLARGAEQTVRVLSASLAEAGLGDDEVLVTVTGCQFPCNHAPVVSVQPDDVWYGSMDPQATELLVRDHLCRSAPVPGPLDAYRLPRQRSGLAQNSQSSSSVFSALPIT